ncbi:MAG TPA: hypothetical protein VGR53_05905 [Nitrososphaerales archaeon]|nr:hypothetical protein [Nitrososphaerales archaeon]
MPEAQPITRELTIGEVISKTFDLYRRDFVKYLVVFLIVEVIIGILTTLVLRAALLPLLTANPTPQQTLSSLSGFFGAFFALIVLVILISPIAIGSAIKMTSQAIEKGQADLGASVRFTISKLVWLWALNFILWVIFTLGFIALIVPGIILAIMFSLAVPAILIENTGVLDGMGRSRKLVDHRWLKSFALYLLVGIFVVILAVILSFISAPFGVVSGIVSNILSAFYLPLVPILLTVYYYSNVARTSPPQSQPSQVPMAPSAVVTPETKFCPRCGTQMASWASVCPKCGLQQPV